MTKSLSATIVSQINNLLSEGLSNRMVANRLGVSASSVSRYRAKIVGCEKIVEKTLHNGRPRKIGETASRHLVRLITSGTMDTAEDVRKHLQEANLAAVSTDTIRRVLKRSGLKAGKKVSKPKLTQDHRRSRLAWAKRHLAWTKEDWECVIWSDETKINRQGSDGKKWCWKSRGKPFEDRVINHTVKHGGGSIMIWACITAKGPGYAAQIVSTMDAQQYHGFIKGPLEDTRRWYELEKSQIIFQHDNDPKHTARSTVQLLLEEGWQVMEWPSQSPDLNPIENLWAHVKKRLQMDSDQPSNLEDLWLKFERIWNEVDSELCKKLVHSMPDRIRSVIKARGGHTKY